MTAPVSSADVAIIGGGIHGCSAALHLRQRGASVVLFEAGLCGAQASGVNFGGVRQHGRDPDEIPLAIRSRALWSRLRDLLGHDGEFVVSGHLRVATGEAQVAELEAWSRLARGHGLTPELIGRNAVRARYPWLSERAVGASLLAEDGQANPRLVSPLFARAARRAGAAINENAKVTGVARDGAGFAIETWNGLTCRARILVNAAGAWGAEIASRLGEKFPLEARGPTMSVTEPLAPFIFPNLGVMDGIYLRQVARGNVVFGGGHSAPDLERRRVRPAPEHMARCAFELQRLVGGAQRATAGGAMPREQVAYQRAAGVVERGERFVKQPQRSAAEPEARECSAPLLTGGQVLARRERITGESDAVEQLHEFVRRNIDAFDRRRPAQVL